MKILQYIYEWRYELIAFFCGLSVMVLEIVGARIMTPYIGASIYTWTTMIGIILASLAAGYWLGGRAADRSNSANHIFWYLFIATLIIALTVLTYQPILDTINGLFDDLRMQAISGALLLFAPPAFFIGCVSPHLAKIRVVSLDETGRRIGRLEAAGTIGSIIGTFLSGFFLLAFLGSHTIMISLAILLLAVSFLADHRKIITWRLLTLATLIIILFIPKNSPGNIIYDVDTAYSRYQVVQGHYNGERANLLVNDISGIQSGFAIDSPNDLLFNYAQKFMTITKEVEPKSVLVIGGGAHTFPNTLVQLIPDVEVDVVEIDPALDSIAKNYFGLKDSPRLNIIHQDGRTYLNQSKKTYYLIFFDAYSNITPPFQLTTVEAFDKAKQRLSSEDGIVVTNLIGRYSGGEGEYVSRLYSTQRQVFAESVLTCVFDSCSSGPDFAQNYIIVSSDKPLSSYQFSKQSLPVSTNSKILTDDFAPVEHLRQLER